MSDRRDRTNLVLAQTLHRLAVYPHLNISSETLWRELGERGRDDWRQRADVLLDLLEDNGLVVTAVDRPPTGPGELVITDLDGVRAGLQEVSRRSGLSLTALARDAKISNSLVSFAHGTSPSQDTWVGPVLKLLTAGDFDMVWRRKPRPTKRAVRLALRARGSA